MNQQSSDLIGQRQLRIEKLNTLRSLGIDPYPAKSFKEKSVGDVVNNFSKLENTETVIVGRVQSLREHGKLSFYDIEEDNFKIQIYVKSDTLEVKEFDSGRSLKFEELNLIDLYDFIEVGGVITKTQSGQQSILAKYIRVLSKTIRPLPNTLEEKEDRFRRRYVDMAVHPEVRERMKRRALFWEAHRQFFNNLGFYEVNIPILEHVPGGGDAVPFTTHMNAINQDFFLRISHELPLKRLIGGGFDKVYDIGARFRNEGLSDEHLPEHVAMEFYWAYADWMDGMKLIQELYTFILDKVYGGVKQFKIREFDVDFSKEWDVIDFNEIFKERYEVSDIYNISLEEVKELLEKNGIEFDRSINIARGVDALWKRIRKSIAGPAFLINHPKYLSPLQKPSLTNPNMVERFQPIIAGSELGNGWSEVNDPIDQYERFMEQQKLRDGGDNEAQWLDIDYVEMLEYGMPPTFGYGHSERVFWFLENVTARDGVPFPQLRFELDNLTKEIYPEAVPILLKEEQTLKKDNIDEVNTLETSDEKDIALPDLNVSQELLNSHVSDTYQLKHALMVAICLREYAKKFNEDEDLWYTTGLLHDLDYSEHPETHPNESLIWLKELNYPDTLIHAVASHAWQRTNIKPETLLDKVLVATDEMCGLIYAYAILRGDFNGIEVKSILKRFKERAFASKINREEIQMGVDLLGVTLEEHVQVLLNALKDFKLD